jgi:hypothetical protein
MTADANNPMDVRVKQRLSYRVVFLPFSCVNSVSPYVISAVRQEIMKRIQVSKVAVLEDGCLGIFPAVSSSMYQYINREAAGVNWNSVLCCFQSTVPREWDYKKWYGQIVSVVLSGFDTRLSQSPKTVPTALPALEAAEHDKVKWVREWVESAIKSTHKEMERGRG